MSAELHAKILAFLAGEFQRIDNRQCTEVELHFAPGNGYKEEPLRKWVRKDEPEIFETHRMSDLVSVICDIAEGEADAKPPGKHRFVVRTHQFAGARIPCSFAIQPTYNGGEEQSLATTGGSRGDGAVIAAHAGQLMRTNAAMFDGTIRVLAQQIENMRHENTEVRAESAEYRKRIVTLEADLDRLQTNRHEREIETIKVTEREKRRSAMAAKFFSDFAPVIMAKLTGGKVTPIAPGERRPRDKVIDQFLKSISSDDARLELIGKMLRPGELDMLSELSQEAVVDEDEPAKVPA